MLFIQPIERKGDVLYALFGTTIALSDPVHGNDKETNMKKQKQNQQDQELQDQQLEKAAGGNTQNQLWGDWFMPRDGAASPDPDSLTAKEGEDASSKDER